MHILLFILYAVVLGWVLTRRPFFRDLRPGILLAFFALHVAAGCLHNWVAYKYFPHQGDIWLFFRNSLLSRDLLYHDLDTFWAQNANWAHLPHNLIEWTHILFNYLSFDNFYINTLFFSFLTLGGQVALFRVFYERFQLNALSATATLLLPSVLFWTSCMHTEGIIYALLGWLFYTMHRSFRIGWTSGRIARAILLTALTIFFRPAIAIGLLPALALWTAAEIPVQRRTPYATAIALLLLFAGFSYLYPQIIPQTLSTRQQEYQSLTGGSRIPLPALEPTWTSLGQVFPYALFNGLFQPLPGAGGQKVYLFFSLELLTVWIIAALAISRYLFNTPSSSPQSTSLSSFIPPSPPLLSPSNQRQRPFPLACLLLSLLGMLLIGCIIPFVGAIIRYRSIYLPFLLGPCLAAFRSLPAYQKLNNALITHIFK